MLRRASAGFGARNLALADILCREALGVDERNATALNLLGRIALEVGERGRATRLFGAAVEIDPRFKAARRNLAEAERALAAEAERADGLASAHGETRAGRYLLIKAWGCGFWSDVDHVLGALLLAEMTGRTPIVRWGANSLFRDAGVDNAWEQFFEPVSDAAPEELLGRGLRFWPPKWNESNVLDDEVNKRSGEHSRVAALSLLNREEEVVVSDHHTGIVNLAPWIRPGHARHGLTVGELHRAMAERYLRPRAEVCAEVEAFAGERMAGGRPVIAAHVRGGDKILEDQSIEAAHELIPGEISKLESRRARGADVFLLTDSAPVHDAWTRRYGERLISTACARTATLEGLHFQPCASRRRLGIEVLRDTYLAARCDAFVGLGSSNVACMAAHLKAWAEGDCVILGPLVQYVPNRFLYES